MEAAPGGTAEGRGEWRTGWAMLLACTVSFALSSMPLAAVIAVGASIVLVVLFLFVVIFEVVVEVVVFVGQVHFVSAQHDEVLAALGAAEEIALLVVSGVDFVEITFWAGRHTGSMRLRCRENDRVGRATCAPRKPPAEPRIISGS